MELLSHRSIIENLDRDGEKKPQDTMGHFRDWDIVHFVNKETHTHEHTDIHKQILK